MMHGMAKRSRDSWTGILNNIKLVPKAHIEYAKRIYRMHPLVHISKMWSVYIDGGEEILTADFILFCCKICRNMIKYLSE